MDRRQLLALGASTLPMGASQAQQRPLRKGGGSGARVGLVLGAGSSRGFAHIGVLQALEEASIAIPVIAGCSAGSLVGAFYASGLSPWQMQDIALKVRDIDVADLSTGNKRGLIAGQALQRLVNSQLKNTPIERLPKRFAAVCTDLSTGERVPLLSGDTGAAVAASCAIPGVFIPATYQGRELVDGGLTSPLPVAVARQMGADFVIAVDVGSTPSDNKRTGLYEIVLQSFEIMGRSLAKLEAKSADMVIQPDTGRFSSTDFSVRKELIEAGYIAAKAAIPEFVFGQYPMGPHGTPRLLRAALAFLGLMTLIDPNAHSSSTRRHRRSCG
jgi:NTE family protein